MKPIATAAFIAAFVLGLSALAQGAAGRRDGPDSTRRRADASRVHSSGQ